MSTALWEAVDALVKPARHRIRRDAAPWVHDEDGALVCDIAEYRDVQQIRTDIRLTGRGNGISRGYADIPSLWDQALAAVATGGESDGTGGATPARERSVADLALMETLLTIREQIGDFHRRRGQRITPAAQVPAELRALASAVVRYHPDLIGEWTHRVRQWARLITNHLQASDEHVVRAVRLRNTACPECHVSQVALVTPDGERVFPALLVDFVGDMIRAATCSYCHMTWWRGNVGELAAALGLDPEPAKELAR